MKGLPRALKVGSSEDIPRRAGRALTTRCLSPLGLHELKHAVPSLSLVLVALSTYVSLSSFESSKLFPVNPG